MGDQADAPRRDEVRRPGRLEARGLAVARLGRKLAALGGRSRRAAVS